MKNRVCLQAVAAMFAAFTLNIQSSAQADTFGSGTNTFTIDFVNIGNAGNGSDFSGLAGAVPYQYRIGKYEISQNQINKATVSGMSNVTAGAWTGDQPAANVSWYEAATFVNWLNTSSGYNAAYNLTFTVTWSMTLWSSADAWTLGGTNLYRNKNAYYFLPSENEWYKAAYYNPAESNYFVYPTASSTAPLPVGSGTNAYTAVYNGVASVPATVDNAGGLSPYGTMAQGGNVMEWNESAFDRENSTTSENRLIRGGGWGFSESGMRSSYSERSFSGPGANHDYVGFRVASVPEPSTYALLLMTGVGSLILARRRR